MLRRNSTLFFHDNYFNPQSIRDCLKQLINPVEIVDICIHQPSLIGVIVGCLSGLCPKAGKKSNIGEHNPDSKNKRDTSVPDAHALVLDNLQTTREYIEVCL